MKRPNHQLELLQIEEADAWFGYLEATRGLHGSRYEAIEPWAYAQMQHRLGTLRARRERLAA